jgi:dolichol-phosphate mannosyltransferase
MSAPSITPAGVRPELVVVMPMYNERASVKKVVTEWFQEVAHWTEDFIFIAINDGSRDDSLIILRKLQERLGERFHIIDQSNKGHGQSCLEGYRLAAQLGAEFVLQIDSDGQCAPQYFFRLWRLREDADVIYGVRTRRDDGFLRLAVSMVLRLFILGAYHAFCPDANVPYRLMRVSVVLDAVNRIPPDFFLANVALAIILARTAGCRHSYVSIRFRERYGGEPTVKASVFARKAVELHKQMRILLDNDRPCPHA